MFDGKHENIMNSKKAKRLLNNCKANKIMNSGVEHVIIDYEETSNL